MAYGLKYVASATNKYGEKVILHISRKGWEGGTYELPTLRSFSLEIQGGQADIAAPIIKTSVHIAVVDAFDEGTDAADGTECVKDGGKWGRFEEFFTPDPFMYLVELLYEGDRHRNPTMWSGFITADSWSEDMTYRGVINLTARDMLGYLDELEFDLTGSCEARDIIDGAAARMGYVYGQRGAMRLNRSGLEGDAHDPYWESLWNNGTDLHILECPFRASAFAGDTWYAALEKTLEALGMVLRYDGDNEFIVTSIRRLPGIHAAGEDYPFTPTFISGSGHRTLDPAVKRVTETYKPDLVAEVLADPYIGDFNLTENTIQAQPAVEGASGQPATWNIPQFYLDGNERPGESREWYGDMAAPASSATQPDGERIAHAMLFPCDTITAGIRQTMNRMAGNTQGCDLTISQDELWERLQLGPTWRRADANTHSVASIECQIRDTDGTSHKWLKADGTWTSLSSQTLTLAPGTPIHVPAGQYIIGVDRWIEVVITKVVTRNTAAVSGPLFAGLGFSLTYDSDRYVAKEYKTVTEAVDDARTEIKRTPSLGAGAGRASNSIASTDMWYWTDPETMDPETAHLPLAVWVHLQLLTNRIQQNGMSVFTGDFVTEGMPLPGWLYTYYGRKCLLLAGTFDFTAGRCTGAILREYADWDDIWDGEHWPAYIRKTSSREGGTDDAEGAGDTTGGGPGDFNADFNLDYKRWPEGMVPYED